VEGVGWLPVVRVAPSLYQQVRAKSRLRALGRLAEYGWALGERYRIEQVFGSVKGAYGSYIGCRRVEYVMVRVWGQLVLWNMVQYLRVRGGGVFCCVWGVVVVWCGDWEGNFRTPSLPLRMFDWSHEGLLAVNDVLTHYKHPNQSFRFPIPVGGRESVFYGLKKGYHGRGEGNERSDSGASYPDEP
jgi:hypothetical protein